MDKVQIGLQRYEDLIVTETIFNILLNGIYDSMKIGYSGHITFDDEKLTDLLEALDPGGVEKTEKELRGEE